MTVHHLRARLAALDTQILQQRRALDELEQSRSDVERELFATATYDVLTLPVEITTEIFLVCHATGPSLLLPHGKHHGTPAPLVLSAVCRGWRTIAHATPALWDSFRVDFQKFTSNTEAADILIDSWLARAQPHPLSLELQCLEVQGSFASVKALTHRWSQQIRSLTLVILADVHELGFDLAAFPILESVMLCCATSISPSIPVGVFQNAPLLHDIQLGWSLYPRQFQFDWEWKRLTKFSGKLDSMELFALAPALVELTCTFLPALDASLVVTQHLTLESLTVADDDGDESLDVLQYLTLPALRRLDIFDSKDNHDSLRLFLARSSPPLISIIVEMNEVCLDQWRKSLLIVASTLERVELHGVHDSDAHQSLTDDFIRPLSDKCLTIQSLTLKSAGECNADILMRLLYALSNRALKSFTFLWDLPPLLEQTAYENEILDTLSGHLCRLSRAGMDIYFGTEDKNYITE
ncbi:hypothetical protein R3P38DRAFT_2832947 [Favolaschia claudopus]|uniref:F-box domain-containing protein n=1 Tax=Favolaschia claudopus TaxID=2862362 RepID=A0AAW0EAS7_9AGAR